MFRDLEDSSPERPNETSLSDSNLNSVFQQRIEDERRKQTLDGSSSVWKASRIDPEEEKRAKEAATAQRDSWLYEDTMRMHTLRPEDSGNYKTSMSNDKYIKYHDPDARDMEFNGAYKQPPHPRQRHRCDYHLEDVLQSAVDHKYSVWETFKVWVACMRSPVGEEPERIRKEVWRW